MKTVTLAVTQMQENTYFYFDETTKDAVVIDPGGDYSEISKCITNQNLNVKAILLTHGHFDHIMAVEEIKNMTGAIVVASKAEMKLLGDPLLNMSFYVTGAKVSLLPDLLVDDGHILDFGSIHFKVLYTPGHTSGGICYFSHQEKIVFSGDTLFYESIGRTDLATASLDTLLKSIKTKLFTLPDDILVYPGHGQSTSIGHEKKHNPYVNMDAANDMDGSKV